jgi:cyclopropane fatty-acyl-phospholipid synthase-like methyltransferase
MISQERKKHWSGNYLAYQQGDSVAIPCERKKKYFKDKHVLEIGPGEGRQFDFVLPLAKSVSIADISENVLNQKKYAKFKNRFLINSYDDDFGKTFDVIHFWYVLHHVKFDELESFFDFIFRHIDKNGTILFNTPVIEYPDPAYGNDGILTTKHDIESVGAALNKHFYWQADRTLYRNSNGYIVTARPL